MKVESRSLTPVEVRQQAEAWFLRQVETLERCHGARWPQHREWIEAFLKEELRQRLIAIGWRPRA